MYFEICSYLQKPTRHQIVTLFVWLSFLSLTVTVSAEGANSLDSEVQIIGIHLEGRLDANPKSGYNLLIAELLPPTLYSNQYRAYPAARAIRDFKANPSACLFPASYSAIGALYPDEQFKINVSDGIDRVSAHIISPPKVTPVSRLTELRGHSIAIKLAVNAQQLQALKSDVKVLRTPDDLTALRTVLAGRADYMYGWYPDIYIIAKNNNLALPAFDPTLIIYETTTHIVCKQFSGNDGILAYANERIKALKSNGKLRSILGKYAQITR